MISSRHDGLFMFTVAVKFLYISHVLSSGSVSRMRCHYDVLGLSRDCGDDDIKKSYRKLALQWHPG